MDVISLLLRPKKVKNKSDLRKPFDAQRAPFVVQVACLRFIKSSHLCQGNKSFSSLLFFEDNNLKVITFRVYLSAFWKRSVRRVFLCLFSTNFKGEGNLESGAQNKHFKVDKNKNEIEAASLTAQIKIQSTGSRLTN